MTDPAAPPVMDHPLIDDDAIVERYHQGRLTPAEEAAFEEHYVGCSACQQELAAHRSFQRGLRAMAAEDLARFGVLSVLLASRLRRALALAAVLVVAATPAFLLWRRGEATAGALAERLAGVEREAAERRTALETRLAAALADAGRLTAPLADLPVYLLRTYRDPTLPEATVELGAGGDPIALAVDVGLAPAADRYRAVLRRGDGAVVFERSDLRPNALEVLLLTFPADFLPAGELALEVEGSGPSGRVEVGRFPIRIVRRAAVSPPVPGGP